MGAVRDEPERAFHWDAGKRCSGRSEAGRLSVEGPRARGAACDPLEAAYPFRASAPSLHRREQSAALLGERAMICEAMRIVFHNPLARPVLSRKRDRRLLPDV